MSFTLSQKEYSSNVKFLLKINQEWHIARARYQVKDLALKHGFGQINLAHLITSLSELSYNLVFHTNNGGTITVSLLFCQDAIGIQLLCIDDGPGITSIKDALTDGFSTNGGLGGGLPGTERLMDEFNIESSSKGTQISCIKWNV
ncbi:hypothetical protein CJF42_08995 [Pseudoalteromonas sp. NBT06-2]|uniref:ATP-binding protein n=1 Tax=Pseudoalteromonas sp. NBT06-2 TaxID=2025950 RepID=UPI000BA6251A|nr:ATP-binding protein [Pseudoalteromonas sp. NBT06-2]PAJ74691.1 hypothetical protein CJF42_08995 [Pseudoalteromonas sp. NBT06-2]